jgi:predicted nuclease with RNAse H fold
MRGKKEKPCLTVLGVDLAGVPHRPTGACLLKGLEAKTAILKSDQDILDVIQKEKPILVTIDAPLSLPPGRESIQQRNGQHFRACDLELRRRKIPFFPITLGPMRMLTERGMGLKKKIEPMGIQTLEIYPGGAQDIWRIPRAKHDLEGLKEGLKRLGIKGLDGNYSTHELDAVTAALVGILYLEGKAEVFGDFSSGAIIMPRPQPCSEA